MFLFLLKIVKYIIIEINFNGGDLVNSEQLSPRLDQVARYVEEYAERPIRLADIGSDHAYLPCHLGINGQLEFAIAGEVVKGPYETAVREVSGRLLDHLIEVRLGDGLDVVSIEDHINTVTICGMGGTLIKNILDGGHEKLAAGAVLILQANLAEAQLRNWLVRHNYEIKMENIVEDNNRLYEIIVAQHNPNIQQILSPKQTMFGPINLRNRTDLFERKWTGELANSQRLLKEVQSGLQDDTHPKVIELQRTIQLIKEELNGHARRN